MAVKICVVYTFMAFGIKRTCELDAYLGPFSSECQLLRLMSLGSLFSLSIWAPKISNGKQKV